MVICENPKHKQTQGEVGRRKLWHVLPALICQETRESK
ncbi:MAG: 50S ribosomal protein L36 [Clostridiales Family XIII bacterium]|nr:50S ribosomal protein L36 [Clostridiales Family XIII bacterium]